MTEEEYLAHFGVLGMKWGKRNAKTPQIAETPEQRRERVLKSTNAKDLYVNRDVLSTAEITERMNRIKTEKQLAELSAEEKTSAQQKIDKILKMGKTANDLYQVYNQPIVQGMINKLSGKTTSINYKKMLENVDNLSTEQITALAKRAASEKALRSFVEGTAQSDTNSDHLAHYGVKGMKWDVKKNPTYDPHTYIDPRVWGGNSEYILNREYEDTKEGRDLKRKDMIAEGARLGIDYANTLIEKAKNKHKLLKIASIPAEKIKKGLKLLAALVVSYKKTIDKQKLEVNWEYKKKKAFKELLGIQHEDTGQSDTNSEHLAHFGVLGMKWGKRKKQVTIQRTRATTKTDKDVVKYINSKYAKERHKGLTTLNIRELMTHRDFLLPQEIDEQIETIALDKKIKALKNTGNLDKLSNVLFDKKDNRSFVQKVDGSLEGTGLEKSFEKINKVLETKLKPYSSQLEGDDDTYEKKVQRYQIDAEKKISDAITALDDNVIKYLDF